MQIGQVQLMIVALQPTIVCFLALIFSHGTPINSLWLQDPQPEAKYRSLAHASTEVAWLHSLFLELGISLVNTLVIWCDNQGVGVLAANPIFHSRTKHIEVDVHYVREQVLDKKN